MRRSLRSRDHGHGRGRLASTRDSAGNAAGVGLVQNERLGFERLGFERLGFERLRLARLRFEGFRFEGFRFEGFRFEGFRFEGLRRDPIPFVANIHKRCCT
jgi:hypothetical protein